MTVFLCHPALADFVIKRHISCFKRILNDNGYFCTDELQNFLALEKYATISIGNGVCDAQAET